jgi:uncharacterized repeat protein (TIGR03803 family)
VVQRTEFGCGVVFKINKDGKETVLHRFNGSDGAWPVGDLVLGPSGNVYGATSAGLTNSGTVFRIGSSGTFAVLHRFGAHNDGLSPAAGVIRDSAGNLYGTTDNGGTSNRGTVYKISPSGQETILHAFTGGTDGGFPDAALVLGATGKLYGTTVSGGDLACNGGTGCGTIFELDPSGHETVLHNFEGKPGEFPLAKLVIDSSGNLYGTTAGNSGGNYGSVFKFIP